MDSTMRRGLNPEMHSGEYFDPKGTPLEELLWIQREKVKDLDFSEEPQVFVSWSESPELLPMASGNFVDNFICTLAQNAERCGFTQFRPVQQAIIPFLNYGSDLCIATGANSGKTTGYMVPMIQKVLDDLKERSRVPGHPRAIILVPTREKGKHTFDLLRILTDGLNINIALSITGMHSSTFNGDRDKSDIAIMTHKSLCALLEDRRGGISFALLKFLVLEGADDLPTYFGRGVGWLHQILRYFDDTTKGAQLITVAEDISFLSSDFSKKRIFSAENIVVIDNGNHRLSPSNHVLLRVNANSVINAMLELIQNYDQGKVVVVLNRNESQSVENVEEALYKAGISYFSYKKRFDLVERTEIQRRFAHGERQVLIVPYCNQIRCLRIPGLSQIIHFEPPFDKDEPYEVSYNFSSSCVAYIREARSVVLCHTDNQLHAGQVAKIAQTIENAPVVDGWPRNSVPRWATDFINGEKRSWTAEDSMAAEELWDLEEAAMIPSENNWETEEYQDDGYHEEYQDDGYRCEMEDNWDCRGIVTNAENYSFESSPSPVPIGDLYRSNGQPENFDPYANSYPQERYVHEWSHDSHWNDCRDSNPRDYPRDRHQNGYEGYDEPDEVPRYEDFEEENVGYEEPRGNGRSRTTSSSSSYYDYQDPRYRQKKNSNRRDCRGQESQDWVHKSTSGTEGTSRQCFEELQNRPDQGFSSEKTNQNNEWDWDDHPMRQRHESSDERLQMDRCQMDRPQRSSGNPDPEAHQQRSCGDKIDSTDDVEPHLSDLKVSTRKDVDEKKETPILGASSDSEDGLW